MWIETVSQNTDPKGAEGWPLSNAPELAMSNLQPSLATSDGVGRIAPRIRLAIVALLGAFEGVHTFGALSKEMLTEGVATL